MTETEKMWAILDLIREGLKAVENNEKLYEEFSNGLKQFVSRVVQTSKAGVDVAAESRNSESKNEYKLGTKEGTDLKSQIDNVKPLTTGLVEATSMEKDKRINQLCDIDNNHNNNEHVHAVVTPISSCTPFFPDGGKSESSLKVELLAAPSKKKNDQQSIIDDLPHVLSSSNTDTATTSNDDTENEITTNTNNTLASRGKSTAAGAGAAVAGTGDGTEGEEDQYFFHSVLMTAINRFKVVVAAESRNSKSKNDCEQLINKIAKNSPQKLVVVVNKCNGNQTISSLVQATSKDKDERISQLYDIDNNDNNERVHALVTPTGACGPFYSDGGKSESNLKVEAPPLDPTTHDHRQQLHVNDHDQPTPIVSNCTMEHDHSTPMTSNCTKKSC